MPKNNEELEAEIVKLNDKITQLESNVNLHWNAHETAQKEIAELQKKQLEKQEQNLYWNRLMGTGSMGTLLTAAVGFLLWLSQWFNKDPKSVIKAVETLKDLFNKNKEKEEQAKDKDQATTEEKNKLN